MANNNPHITIECRECVVLMQDTFAGVLSDRQPNNCKLSIKKPIEYFYALQKELNYNLHKKNPKGSYTLSIKVNPKDHRSFLSAELRYGRRVLTYTNVASMPHARTNEKNTVCKKETTIIATRKFKVSRTMKAWAEAHEQSWFLKGYKGKFTEVITAKGTYIGKFVNEKENKKIDVTSRFTSKTTITITLIQTYTIIENINSELKPQVWLMEIKKEMAENKFKGDIRTYVNSYGRTIIEGAYTKTAKVDNGGTNEYTILYYNQTERPKRIPFEDPETWRPTKKLGKSVVQVRSIAQDDQYTPEFRGKKINWDRIQIQKEYEEYMRMPAKELELSLKRLEAMDERAASKGDKIALKWLRSLKKSRPSWLQAPNAESLVLYCVKYLKQEVMTISEANNFCKRNAYKKTSV